jgi:hypothetical protein
MEQMIDGVSVLAKYFDMNRIAIENALFAPVRDRFQPITIQRRSRRSGLGLERLLGLHREANRDIGGTVKLLEDLVAEHATIFTLYARP